MQKIRDTIYNTTKRVKEMPKKAGEKAEEAFSMSKKVIYYTLVSSFTLSLLTIVSTFMYVTFYLAFVPTAEFQGELNPTFKSCDNAPGRCSNLNGTIHLSPRDPVLMTGQDYSITIILEMPESDKNRKLGMFMSCLTLINSNYKAISKSCKSKMMQYRSELLRVIETFAFAPFLLTERMYQKQYVYIDFFSEFRDDPLNPVVRMELDIQSKFVELYSMQFQIRANFGGLRYLMFFYPLSSAFVGIAFNTMFLSFLVLLSWYRFVNQDKNLQFEENQFNNKRELFMNEKIIEDTDSESSAEVIEGSRIQNLNEKLKNLE